MCIIARSLWRSIFNLIIKKYAWYSVNSQTQVGASKLLQSVDTFTGAFVKALNGSHNGSLRIVQENIGKMSHVTKWFSNRSDTNRDVLSTEMELIYLKIKGTCVVLSE